jgi:DNA-binding HxlR family transcriptional regulator
MALRDASDPRSYGDACPAARALDLVGARWALLVVRELLWGPRRFTDLKAALPGIATNVLAQRLADLESAGVLAAVALPPPARAAYALTERGAALRPTLRALAAWGDVGEGPLTAASALLRLEARWDPGRAEGLRVTADLRLPEGDWTLRARKGRLGIEAGRHADPDCVVTTTPGALPQGAVEGDAKAWARLARAFR